MRSFSFKTWKLPALIFGFAGLSFLLASCAGTNQAGSNQTSTNQKTAAVGSPFPYDYNADARGFEGTWPFGRGGYK